MSDNRKNNDSLSRISSMGIGEGFLQSRLGSKKENDDFANSVFAPNQQKTAKRPPTTQTVNEGMNIN